MLSNEIHIERLCVWLYTSAHYKTEVYFGLMDHIQEANLPTMCTSTYTQTCFCQIKFVTKTSIRKLLLAVTVMMPGSFIGWQNWLAAPELRCDETPRAGTS